MALLVLRPIFARSSAYSSKYDMARICHTKVKVERYGGGWRWYCPKCDIYSVPLEPIKIYWTNSTPPELGLCPNKIVTPIEKLRGRGIKLKTL